MEFSSIWPQIKKSRFLIGGGLLLLITLILVIFGGHETSNHRRTNYHHSREAKGVPLESLIQEIHKQADMLIADLAVVPEAPNAKDPEQEPEEMMTHVYIESQETQMMYDGTVGPKHRRFANIQGYSDLIFCTIIPKMDESVFQDLMRAFIGVFQTFHKNGLIIRESTN